MVINIFNNKVNTDNAYIKKKKDKIRDIIRQILLLQTAQFQLMHRRLVWCAVECTPYDFCMQK